MVKKDVTMVGNDPFVVYNDEMKKYASDLFKEAESLGYKTKEDKARYLSGKLFEISPFGLHEGIMGKDAVDLFNGLMSDDENKHYMACVHKTIVQRALLESQGIKTRNHMYHIVPFSYPFKPVESETIRRMNTVARGIIKPLNQLGIAPTFPHMTTDIYACEDEENQKKCEWKTIDATFDDTTRFLKIRPMPDRSLDLGDGTPELIESWQKDHVDTNPLVSFLYNTGQTTPAKEALRVLFDVFWFGPLMEANEHIKKREKESL